MLKSIGKHLIRNEGSVVATIGLGLFILTPVGGLPLGCLAAGLVICGAGMTP